MVSRGPEVPTDVGPRNWQHLDSNEVPRRSRKFVPYTTIARNLTDTANGREARNESRVTIGSCGESRDRPGPRTIPLSMLIHASRVQTDRVDTFRKLSATVEQSGIPYSLAIRIGKDTLIFGENVAS